MVSISKLSIVTILDQNNSSIFCSLNGLFHFVCSDWPVRFSGFVVDCFNICALIGLLPFLLLQVDCSILCALIGQFDFLGS